MNSKAADILADLQQEERGRARREGGRGGGGEGGRQGKGTYIKHIGFCNSKF